MSFLSGTALLNLTRTNIFPFDEKRIVQASYELSLGHEVYLTDSKNGKPELLDDKNKTVEINPGQFALLLTKEKVTVPRNKICFISIKAGEKLKGLVNVSGFHVDPGFDGQLLFSVYNAGPSIITLKKDEPYFPIWFSELITELSEEEAYNDKKNTHQSQSSIPTKYIDALKRGELASPSSIVNKIKEVENDFKNAIKDVERKKIRNEYLLTLLIGLLISIGVKLYWDSKAEESGYQKRMKEEAAIEEIKKAAKEYRTDSVFLYKIDSIINTKIRSNNVAH